MTKNTFFSGSQISEVAMGMFQEEYEKCITKFVEKIDLKREVLSRIFKQKNLAYTNDDLARVLIAIENPESTGKTEITVPLSSPFTFTIQEFQAAMEDIEASTAKAFETAIMKSLEEPPKEILQSLYKTAPENIANRKTERLGFEKRLYTRWQGGLDRMTMLILITTESANMYLNDIHNACEDFTDEENETLEVLIRLHSRACRIYSEILCLLVAGYADGASARWRSLHELAVIALFISQSGRDTAKRFKDHIAIETYHESLQYMEHCSRLQEDPIDEEDFDKIKSKYDEAINKYGKNFDSDYGWAAKILSEKRPSFKRLEEAIDLDHWRPYYKLACNAIHTSSKGMYFSLGLLNDNWPCLLAGASNAGLQEPGQLASISLNLISSTLLTYKPNLDSLVAASVMRLLVQDIQSTLVEIHEKLEQEEQSEVK